MSIYIGYNIHNYTSQIVNIIPKFFEDMEYKKVDIKYWNKSLNEIKKKYPNHIAIKNIERNFNNGFIKDPEIPKLNFAIILLIIWDNIKNNDIICNHFLETLNEIGNTCIQGISHRLIIDYIAIYNDILDGELSKYFNIKIQSLITNYL
jgi:hypothetical protein